MGETPERPICTRGKIPARRMTLPERDTGSTLLARLRDGDPAALEILVSRCLPRLRRWAHNRLPSWARDLADTQDLLQEAILGTCRRIDVLKFASEAALEAYLRQAVANRIRNEIRRVARRPPADPLSDSLEEDRTSPLEAAIGREAAARYEAALARLSDAERQAVIARVELGSSYEDIARILGRPTPNAARMAVTRAILRLGEEMSRG
jgi:RNA polymerase sigma-70 factor (ECF subfamily)